MKILVTGGCGFIGGHLVRLLIEKAGHEVLNVDCLTHAAHPEALADLEGNACYQFAKVDIGDGDALRQCFREFAPDWVMHLAAESHVDRSITGPGDFVQTNVVGTYQLLQVALDHYQQLEGSARDRFRFLHVSTDEVYGSLGPEGEFCETSPYAPRSPYSASKAAADHFVMAWHATYGLPVIRTHCSNNYGPHQLAGKLIPVVMEKALSGEPIPVYGDGRHVRDWLHVRDHVEALELVMRRGTVAEAYHISGGCPLRNIDLVRQLCGLLDRLRPRPDGKPYANQITFVADRPGHDLRYAMDGGKIRRELGWSPQVDPEAGFEETVRWYLE